MFFVLGEEELVVVNCFDDIWFEFYFFKEWMYCEFVFFYECELFGVDVLGEV